MAPHRIARLTSPAVAALTAGALGALATVAASAPASAARSGAPPAAHVAAANVRIGTARNAQLGRTVLVTRGGRTLYTLSAERRGRFICTTRFCLSLWTPLTLPRGRRAVGVAHLGVVRRPDGRRQASFRGRPLYTFVRDRRRGDAMGEGFRDVGVWHAAVAP